MPAITWRRMLAVGVTAMMAVAIPTRAGAEPRAWDRSTLVQGASVGAAATLSLAPRLPIAPPAVHATVVAGGVLPFGGAPNYGSLAGRDLSGPVVAIAPTPDGHGYWLAASDGGIFTFGDAHFYGSTGHIHLNQPIVAMAPTPDGHGYWLAASDGGIFTFGDAHFYGSAGDRSLAEPIAGDKSPGIIRDEHGNGYWLYEGRRAVVATDPFTPTLVSALNERSGVISAYVLDLGTGDAYAYRPGQRDITASIVKVEILGTLLREAQAQGRGLNQTEQSLALSMIEDSDNDSATDLWTEEGGAPAVVGFDTTVGMSSTTVSYAWGLTVTTAADQVALLDHLVEANSVLTAASRAYELGLMEHVTPSQAWGVSAGVAPGVTVALKNGWLPVGADWEVNSIGWVDGDGHDYLIAVMSSGNPSEGYGIESISLVAEAAWAALGGS